MMQFEWSQANLGTAKLGDDKVLVIRKPDFGFEYQQLYADLDAKEGVYWGGGLKSSALNESQLQLIRAYLEGMTEATSNKPSAPGLDSSGRFIGMVNAGEGASAIRPPPAETGWLWIEDDWYEDMPLQAHKERALTTLDREAGNARARYITVAPGQEGTYILKAAEALIWVKDPTSEPGPFLMAEAEATGLPIQVVIKQIAQVSLAWSQAIGPAIERERRRAKIRVAAASTIPQVGGELGRGVAALSKI